MSERERKLPYNITYMQNHKYDTNEPIWKIETDSLTKQISGYQWGRAR